jgi:hypothetical protein
MMMVTITVYVTIMQTFFVHAPQHAKNEMRTSKTPITMSAH